MKKILCENMFLVVALSFMILCQIKSFAQEETTYFTFSESFSNNPQKSIKLPAMDKVDRVSARASVIKAKVNTSDEQIRKCLDYALSVWRSQISDYCTININVEVEDIEADIVTYVQYRQVGDVYLPTALQAYKENTNARDSASPDGIIKINSSTQWDYSLGEEIPEDCKSLTFAFLRSIANILGFGSSVGINSDGQYYFGHKRGYSVFDGLVVNSNNVKMTSIGTNGGRPNPALGEYVQSGTKCFWVSTETANLELESPPYTTSNPPFTFLKDNYSLMSSTFGTGNYALRIDEKTVSVLNTLGWNATSNIPVKIVSDELGETGLASAYTSHLFRVDHGTQTIKDPVWRLEMPLAGGGKSVMVLSDDNLSCCVPEITDETDYLVNQDGDIEGLLFFSGKINGVVVEASPYRISFELKPFIEEAVIEQIHDNSPLVSYDAYFKVKYRGASKMTVAVEEEYSSILKCAYVKEPYIATGVVQYIKSRYHAWMDFIVENKYGKTVHTIELGPYGEIIQPARESTASSHRTYADVGSLPDNIDRYEAYDLNGNKIAVCESMDELGNLKGLYIVKCYNSGILVKTIKLFKQ